MNPQDGGGATMQTHFTARRGFIAGTGFGMVSLHLLWSGYGAAPLGLGGTLMSVAVLAIALAFAANLLPVGARGGAVSALPEVDWGAEAPAAARAWTGPLAVLVVVGLTVDFTVLAFELMRALPLVASGSTAH